MNLTIRKMREEDLDELTEMWYSLAKMHEDIMEGYELSENPKNSWKKFMKKSFDKEKMTTFVAENNENLIGFVSVVIRRRPPFFEDRDVGMILDLYVKESFRNKGVGGRLVSEAETWIKENKVDVAVLTVAPVNIQAKIFWNARGYSTYLEKKRKELR
ncbi:MAG: N-acetyltransferase family protein [Thermoplasmatota archaeon]